MNVALSEVWAKGGEGGQALADEVVRLCEEGDAKAAARRLSMMPMTTSLSLAQKIEAIATRVYRARRRGLRARRPQRELEKLEDLGFGGMPVCMAKTQYSLLRRRQEAGRAARASASRCAT